MLGFILAVESMFVFPGWDILYLTICWGLTLTTSTLLTVSAILYVLVHSSLDDWSISCQRIGDFGPLGSFYDWSLSIGSCHICGKNCPIILLISIRSRLVNSFGGTAVFLDFLGAVCAKLWDLSLAEWE
jgi:hypothetical protein